MDVVVSDNNLPAITTGAVSITAGTASQFTFVQPTAAVTTVSAGTTFQPVVVETTDGYGNIVSNYGGSNVTMTLGSFVPSSGLAVTYYASASQSTPITTLAFTNNGSGTSATFYAYFGSATTGTSYSYLTGTGTINGNAAVDSSNAFNVVAGAATQLALVPSSETYSYNGGAATSWSSSSTVAVPAGAVMQFAVQAEDQFGNLATSSYGHPVVMGISDGTYTGYTFYATNPGPGDVNKVAAITSYTFTYGTGASFDNGVHTFFAIMTKSTTASQTVSMTVTDSALSAAHRTATTTPFTVTAGNVAKLVTSVASSQAVDANGGSDHAGTRSGRVGSVCEPGTAERDAGQHDGDQSHGHVVHHRGGQHPGFHRDGGRCLWQYRHEPGPA